MEASGKRDRDGWWQKWIQGGEAHHQKDATRSPVTPGKVNPLPAGAQQTEAPATCRSGRLPWLLFWDSGPGADSKAWLKPFGNSGLSRVNITCLLPPVATMPGRYPGRPKGGQLSCPNRARNSPQERPLLPMAPFWRVQVAIRCLLPNSNLPHSGVLTCGSLGRSIGSRWQLGPAGGRGPLGSRCRFRRGWGLKGSRDLGRLKNFPPQPPATAGFFRNLMT